MKIYQKNGLVIVAENEQILDVLPAADIRMTRGKDGIMITSIQHNFYRLVKEIMDEQGNTYASVDEAITYLTENLGQGKTDDTREFSDEFSDEFN